MTIIMDVVMLNNNRLKTLRSLVRVKRYMFSVAERSQLDFLFKTGRCSPDFLRTIADLLSDKDSSLVEEWLNENTYSVNIPESKRSPELEARIQRLKAEQEGLLYKEMVKNVDPVLLRERQNKFGLGGNVGMELKTVNKQLVVILNMILTVAGAFAFGYKGVELAIAGADIASRLILGFVLATIVFFADLYFVVKSIDLEFH